VIFAVGEVVEKEFVRASGLNLKESDTIDVNRFSLQTSRPKFYAGGDVVTGAANVSTAMSYGKLAARTIDFQLMEVKRWNRIQPDLEYEQNPPDEPSENRRHHGREISPAARARSNEEVNAGFTHEEALDEACRCLRCDVTVGNAS
jgi:NADH-quinone oxidoreductase subunit F